MASMLPSLTSSTQRETSGGKYMLGFILTLAASATYCLNLSLMELTFHKIIKCRALSAVLNMQIYTALVSTVGAIIGLFASGEWRELKKDMEGFNQGRLSYVMTLVWTSICWQVTNVGLVGLIFEVSSLFSNVISSLAVPIAPVFAVILFHDTINGIKVMSLLCPLLQYSIVFNLIDCSSFSIQSVQLKDYVQIAIYEQCCILFIVV
ncbi:Purine permease plant protein [Dioscorea alata]|uniref:Purine permease plant protein n=1 Tax=Dioscorea alata TaxID=55571 RepID=A0ACB7WKM7_DIOAL|nr:Purine permease plant protein [Dioscorea alata]